MSEDRNILGDLLDRPVQGTKLNPGSFRDQLGPGATLVVFLRHFG